MEYKLIEKKIRDMIIYNNQMVVKFPKHEKFLMANKIRELGYSVLELCIVCNKKVHKKNYFDGAEYFSRTTKTVHQFSFRIQIY